jgi:hypothetical protein
MSLSVLIKPLQLAAKIQIRAAAAVETFYLVFISF